MAAVIYTAVPAHYKTHEGIALRQKDVSKMVYDVYEYTACCVGRLLNWGVGVLERLRLDLICTLRTTLSVLSCGNCQSVQSYSRNSC